MTGPCILCRCHPIVSCLMELIPRNSSISAVITLSSVERWLPGDCPKQILLPRSEKFTTKQNTFKTTSLFLGSLFPLKMCRRSSLASPLGFLLTFLYLADSKDSGLPSHAFHQTEIVTDINLWHEDMDGKSPKASKKGGSIQPFPDTINLCKPQRFSSFSSHPFHLST